MSTERRRATQEIWRDRDEFRQSVRDWALQIRVTPTRVRVQEMRRKWASCSQDGVVTFSLDLLSEKRSFGEAVIVHELVHLKVRNHGRLFQSLIRSYLGPRQASLADVTELRTTQERTAEMKSETSVSLVGDTQ